MYSPDGSVIWRVLDVAAHTREHGGEQRGARSAVASAHNGEATQLAARRHNRVLALVAGASKQGYSMRSAELSGS
jgi:hypothetical protein